MSHMAVIGAGAWGTALARVLAGNGFSVALWTWQLEHAQRMRETRTNEEFLPGFTLADEIRPTANLEEAIVGARIALICVPSQVVRPETSKASRWLSSATTLVNATKGIEESTLMLMSEVVEDVLGQDVRARFAVLSGPSFAREVAANMPTNVVVAGTNSDVVDDVQRVFSSDRMRVYASSDSCGVQLGGALKNVIAIAAGACDGIGFGHNELADFYNFVDCFVLPSRVEPFGITVLEAMSCGKPVVASRVGGIPEIIDDGEDGILVPPEDSAALRKSLKGLAASKARREDLGLAARNKVVRRFSPEKTYELMKSLYDAVLEGGYRRSQ